MENFTLEKADGHLVACVSEIPDHPKGIAIAVHGFTSSKESSTVQLLLKRLPEAGIGVIGIDLPAHGTGVSKEEELRIKACMDSLEAAEKKAVSLCPDVPVFYFASSFGAYITSLYISERAHKGRRAFFRSAAVNMPSLFEIDREHPTELERELLEELDRKGYIQPSFDLGSPIKVTKAMLDDLASNNLFEKFSPDRYGSHQIAMAHGAADQVIDPEAAAKFARQFDLPITFFEGEGHSLSDHPDTPDKVAALAVRLFLQA